ncbi:trigger factor [Umboniibacter marinipuniceus]|uniref:Trigger factor n=1 Tax=Umboniibacter marinipuniceus TaxID=569599 RepID=A0A3M0A7I6_9GAMM|nr:trigger factor [Umboniibacter marinipuniceus]RMA81043.1 trigger factor [Umboniibacter marinipuniceus]
MQVSLETTNGLERRMTVTVPSASVDAQVEERIKQASKTVKINGFRNGKVPLKVVKQRFGGGIRQEVLGDAINRAFYEAVQAEKVRPAGAPNIEPKNLEEGSDIEFVATFEVYPEIELADMSAVEVTKPVAEVNEDDINNMIEILRKQQGEFVEVDRAAAEGDKVNINYVGTKDGEEFEGGKAEGSDLTLGSKQMIPGFEDGIAGMKAGEERTIDVTFPEEYHSEELKGAAVQFAITVNKVEAQQLPELDDAFFEKYGVSEGGEEKFREEVAANMARELKNAVTNKVKTQVMDALVEKHEFDVPAALLTNEIAQLRQQMMQQFGGGQNIDPSILPDDLFKDQAERRVKLGLVMGEVISAKKLTVAQDLVDAKLAEVASTYQDPQEVIDYYKGNQELLSGIQNVVLEDQAVEAIIADVKVVETEVSYDEAIKPADQAANA